MKPTNSGDEDAALLEFTRPNLAFLLEARHGRNIRLRVQLSAGADGDDKNGAPGPAEGLAREAAREDARGADAS